MGLSEPQQERHGGLELVILFGPPGSGKTAVGHELASAYGYRYREYEAELVELYGPLETFVRYRKQAVADVHAAILGSIDRSLPLAVLETTALSEREFIDGLIRDRSVFTVCLDVPLELAIERVESRPRGRNLSNGPGTNQRIWERFAEAHRDRQYDLRIDTGVTDVAESARLIDEAVRARLLSC